MKADPIKEQLSERLRDLEALHALHQETTRKMVTELMERNLQELNRLQQPRSGLLRRLGNQLRQRTSHLHHSQEKGLFSAQNGEVKVIVVKPEDVLLQGEQELSDG